MAESCKDVPPPPEELVVAVAVVSVPVRCRWGEAKLREPLLVEEPSEPAEPEGTIARPARDKDVKETESSTTPSSVLLDNLLVLVLGGDERGLWLVL